MILYKVSYKTDGGTCAGFTWHPSKREADRAARIYKREAEPDEALPEVQPVAVVLTKGGILSLLFHHAQHPDNG
jgi:hypothetical protein